MSVAFLKLIYYRAVTVVHLLLLMFSMEEPKLIGASYLKMF